MFDYIPFPSHYDTHGQIIRSVFFSKADFNKLNTETWVLKKREEQRLAAAQMKFLRHLLGITKLYKEKNQCVRQKTGVQNIVKEIKQYQKKWLQHVQRMDTNRLPKQALQYKPKGRRNIGRPRKRWRDQLHLEKTVPWKVATKPTEDGHKQTAKRNITI